MAAQGVQHRGQGEGYPENPKHNTDGAPTQCLLSTNRAPVSEQRGAGTQPAALGMKHLKHTQGRF